jgi:hypothetical protein
MTRDEKIETLRDLVRDLLQRVATLERERPVVNRMWPTNRRTYLMKDGRAIRRKEFTS